MNIEEILSNHSIRKKFVKGYNYPIHLLQDPYFGYLLGLYNTYILDKWVNVFKPSLEKYSNSEEFFQDHKRVENEAINYLKNGYKYSSFESQTNDYLNLKSKKFNKNEYLPENDGKIFRSIDISKANFSIFQYFNIIEDSTYEDFISRFTDNQFFKESKHLRQVIFGHLNPKRQQKVQEYFIRRVIEDLTEMYGDDIEIYKVGSDEVIFTTKDKMPLTSDDLRKFNCPLPLKLNNFKVSLLSEKRNVYVKEYRNHRYDKRFELKNVPSYFYPQYFKYYLGIPLNDWDLVFYHEGKLAKFLEYNEDII